MNTVMPIAALGSLFGRGQEETNLTRRLELCKLDIEDLVERMPLTKTPIMATYVGTSDAVGIELKKGKQYQVHSISSDGETLQIRVIDDEGVNYTSGRIRLATVPMNEVPMRSSDESEPDGVEFILSIEDIRRTLFNHHRKLVVGKTMHLLQTYSNFILHLPAGEVKYLDGIMDGMGESSHSPYGFRRGDLVRGRRYMDGNHGLGEATIAVVLTAFPAHPWLVHYNRSNHRNAIEDADCLVVCMEDTRHGPAMRIYASNSARLRRIDSEDEIGVIANPYSLVKVEFDYVNDFEHRLSALKQWIGDRSIDR